MGLFRRPNNVPGEPAFLQQPDAVAGAVKFPPAQSMRRATRLGMMIVVITFAKPDDADQKVVSTMIGSVKAPIPKLWHVADRIDRPGDIVIDKHRHIKAPKHSGNAKTKE